MGGVGTGSSATIGTILMPWLSDLCNFVTLNTLRGDANGGLSASFATIPLISFASGLHAGSDANEMFNLNLGLEGAFSTLFDCCCCCCNDFANSNSTSKYLLSTLEGVSLICEDGEAGGGGEADLALIWDGLDGFELAFKSDVSVSQEALISVWFSDASSSSPAKKKKQKRGSSSIIVDQIYLK